MDSGPKQDALFQGLRFIGDVIPAKMFVLKAEASVVEPQDSCCQKIRKPSMWPSRPLNNFNSKKTFPASTSSLQYEPQFIAESLFPSWLLMMVHLDFYSSLFVAWPLDSLGPGLTHQEVQALPLAELQRRLAIQLIFWNRSFFFWRTGRRSTDTVEIVEMTKKGREHTSWNELKRVETDRSVRLRSVGVSYDHCLERRELEDSFIEHSWAKRGDV